MTFCPHHAAPLPPLYPFCPPPRPPCSSEVELSGKVQAQTYALSLSALGNYKRNVIVLFVRAEAADGMNNRIQQGRSRKLKMAL